MRHSGHVWTRKKQLNAQEEEFTGTQSYLREPFKTLSWKHSRWSAAEAPLSKECRSSESRQRRASLLVTVYNAK